MDRPDQIHGFGPPQVKPAGDSGLLIEFGAIYHPLINAAAVAFDAALDAKPLVGVLETAPSFRSVLIRFDPRVLAFDDLTRWLQDLLATRDWYQQAPATARRKWVLPAVYGGEHGPHLGEVADIMGLREDQVVDSHATAPLRVAMLGFSPGLAYLGQLPEIWQFARKTTITPEVPAGAVLVAVRQTVFPGTPIPTGWRQIAQSPVQGFNALLDHPFLLSPGDDVRFEPVSAARFSAFDMASFLRESEQ